MSLALSPSQEWWTAAELAEAGLPDVPGTKRRVNAMADTLGWSGSKGRARRRAGRGGGWEYHWSLLPRRARVKLIADATRPSSVEPEAPCEGVGWAEFEKLPESAQAKARAAFDALQVVEGLIAGGHTAQEAVAAVAELRGVSKSSIWGGRKKVRGAAVSDWLPLLAPKHRTAVRKVESAEVSDEAWDAFRADWLRLARPSLTTCWRRTNRLALKHGWAWPSEQTIRRKVKAEIPRTVRVLAREGSEALKRLYPPQVREKGHLRPLEWVNADFHRFDVFVEWEPGRIIRPQMVSFEDIYSGAVLAWRVDETPNSLAVSLALGDLVEDWGTPEHCLLDNGREFASKWITGGAPTRYRFKVRENDPLGILPTLGVQVHWATPFAGQSKPVERTFRDHCDAISKDPRFDGAWTGNRPEAKPEDYGSRAIPREDFLRVVAEGIAEHNSRPGRRSAVAAGRSLQETFDVAYATAPIRKATPEQRRLWLCGAEGLRGHSEHGGLKLLENIYWSPWMTEIAGVQVVGRFDPADLHAGLHVYAADGRYLGHADCTEKGRFDSLEDAKAHNRARAAWRRAQKAELDAHKRVSRTALGRMLDDAADAPSTPPEAKVIKLARAPEDLMRAPARPAPAEATPEMAAKVADLAERMAARDAARAEAAEAEDRDDKHDRCLSILRRVEAGDRVGEEERRWAESYRQSSEYRATAQMRALFGEGGAEAAED